MALHTSRQHLLHSAPCCVCRASPLRTAVIRAGQRHLPAKPVCHGSNSCRLLAGPVGSSWHSAGCAQRGSARPRRCAPLACAAGAPEQQVETASSSSSRSSSASEASSSAPAGGNGNGRGAGARGGPAERARYQSSWTAREASSSEDGEAPEGPDYLQQLGQAEYNINVDHGQNISQLDSLFVGDILGKKSDIADGSLRQWDFRRFEHLVGDYYIAPRFLDAVTMHIVKNYMEHQGSFDAQLRVPLILGIWGGKGQGKTFQTELAFKKLKVEPIVMSAGELEHEWAGTPGRLIRERYRRAAELSKVHGKLSCLLINDIDAGLGHFANTQVTVNNQIVVGTLMNLCDNPSRVSLGYDWLEDDHIQRIPIIVTGNDLSTMFAPLLRDGRMAKFYWEPSREDLVSILHQMYKDDGLSREDMGVLLDTFSQQPLDFFGALRSSQYDAQIRDWIREVAQADLSSEDANMAAVSRRLLRREDLPTFAPMPITVDMLLAEGWRLAGEQELVNSHRLADEYMNNSKRGQAMPSILGLQG